MTIHDHDKPDVYDDNFKLPQIPHPPRMPISVTTASRCTSTPGTPIAINWNSSGSKESHRVFFKDKDNNLGVLASYKSPPTTNPSLTTPITTESVCSIANQLQTTKIHATPLTLTLTKLPSALSPRTSAESNLVVVQRNTRSRGSASVPSFDSMKVSASAASVVSNGHGFTGDLSWDKDSVWSNDYDHDHVHHPDYESDEKCTCGGGDVDGCMSMKRIIDALAWYAVSGDDHESVYKKMQTNNYGRRIVDDYNHIMDYHLNDIGKTDREIRAEYELIVNKVHAAVGDCKFIQCAGYRRYLRCKNAEMYHGHQAKNKEQYELQMYVNTMDGIHCCFMHLAKSLRN